MVGNLLGVKNKKKKAKKAVLGSKYDIYNYPENFPKIVLYRLLDTDVWSWLQSVLIDWTRKQFSVI